jgi:2-polyprenyl-3-methyl-5-hydroxy-6-metoxy-1,4-benzoquinol methylase
MMRGVGRAVRWNLTAIPLLCVSAIIFLSQFSVIGWIQGSKNCKTTIVDIRNCSDHPVGVHEVAVQAQNSNTLMITANSVMELDISKKLFADQLDTYSAEYWQFQYPLGKMGGVLELWKFEPLISPGSTCVDFGAGGGFLLHNLPDSLCAMKMGVEVNPHGRANALSEFGLHIVNNSRYLPDDEVDVVISNHVLEHVLCPWCELLKLLHKLKRGTGRAVFVVPHASQRDEWTGTPDVNNHISTFSPNTVGHLFAAAGFERIKVETLKHQWPDNAMDVYQKEGKDAFIQKGMEKNAAAAYPGCEVQLRVIGYRPA